jgi:hypothetical protein
VILSDQAFAWRIKQFSELAQLLGSDEKSDKKSDQLVSLLASPFFSRQLKEFKTTAKTKVFVEFLNSCHKVYTENSADNGEESTSEHSLGAESSGTETIGDGVWAKPSDYTNYTMGYSSVYQNHINDTIRFQEIQCSRDVNANMLSSLGIDDTLWDNLCALVLRECYRSHLSHGNSKREMPFEESIMQRWLVPLLKFVANQLRNKYQLAGMRVEDATGKPKLFSNRLTERRCCGFSDIMFYVKNHPRLAIELKPAACKKRFLLQTACQIDGVGSAYCRHEQNEPFRPIGVLLSMGRVRALQYVVDDNRITSVNVYSEEQDVKQLQQQLQAAGLQDDDDDNDDDDEDEDEDASLANFQRSVLFVIRIMDNICKAELESKQDGEVQSSNTRGDNNDGTGGGKGPSSDDDNDNNKRSHRNQSPSQGLVYSPSKTRSNTSYGRSRTCRRNQNKENEEEMELSDFSEERTKQRQRRKQKLATIKTRRVLKERTVLREMQEADRYLLGFHTCI